MVKSILKYFSLTRLYALGTLYFPDLYLVLSTSRDVVLVLHDDLRADGGDREDVSIARGSHTHSPGPRSSCSLSLSLSHSLTSLSPLSPLAHLFYNVTVISERLPAAARAWSAGLDARG